MPSSWFRRCRILKAHIAQLGIESVDLYLIHNPRSSPDVARIWAEFERLQTAGLAKLARFLDSSGRALTQPCRSIGVSNFNLEQLQLLVKEANVVPAVNQVRSAPHVITGFHVT